MSNVALIPARGGSKRIPKKNIKDFLGKPIIAYSIESALKSNLFSEVIISTDSEEIAEIAEKYGAKIPFFRSGENANDYAGITDVLKEVISTEYIQKNRHENCCCILPTSPLLTSENIIKAYNILNQKHFDSVFSVAAFSYPIFRALKVENEKSSLIWPENLTKRSQDLPKAYHDAGQFYWFSINEFIKKGQVFTDNTGVIELSELEVQDIDTETDWKIAELKYKLLNGQ